MKIEQNRKEWRSNTIRHLVENGHDALGAINGTKKIEEYLFDSEKEVIVRVENDKQREALKLFIESLQPT